MKYNSNLNFIFTTCQVGAEKALKNELAREYPDFNFAYSRPGFLTFKRTVAEIPFNINLNSVFARTYGVSVGVGNSTEVIELVKDFLSSIEETVRSRTKRLHVWERDQYAPGEEPKGFVVGNWTKTPAGQSIESLLREALPDFFDASVEAGNAVRNAGSTKPSSKKPVLLRPARTHLNEDFVLDIIAVDPDRFWVGAHFHSQLHSPWPGARSPRVLPPEAPSRAYLKLEDSLDWSRAPIRAKDVAVEVGSAPGGASYALLKRGLTVVGVDPAEMAPQVLAHPSFRHLQQTVAETLREDLPQSVEWFLLDMNVEPRISLYAVDRLVSRMKDSLLGVFLTVKLNKWAFAEQIPEMLTHVRAMGMVKLRAAQLANNRQEIMIYGLTRKGISRKNEGAKKYE